MSGDDPTGGEGVELLPNLGAEEGLGSEAGDDWRAYHAEPVVRAAAGLWCLLYGRGARLRAPEPGGRDAGEPADWSTTPRDHLWPADLGPAPDAAAFDWLESSPGVHAWLPTDSIARAAREGLGRALAGPPPDVVTAMHDKAFAVETAAGLGLVPRALEPLVRVLSPEDCRAGEATLTRLERELADWPAWTRGRYTLKPRFGSSGRGRVGGAAPLDREALRGALARMAERGGAVFEPWLERAGDFGVALLLPPADRPDALPTLLGSLEMLNAPGGLYRGHFGELDHRGRVFSGDREDETLRAEAAAVAGLARTRGLWGVCGVDAFRYREPAPDGNPDDATDAPEPPDPPAPPGRLRWRGAVELNARPTMGLVAIGLARRARAIVRDRLGLDPGDRRAFALLFPAGGPEGAADLRRRIEQALGNGDGVWLDLSPPSGTHPASAAGGRAQGAKHPPRPALVLAREPGALRDAIRAHYGV